MMGKPVSQALGEVKTCAVRARYMMGAAAEALADVALPPMAGFERRIVREPLGVIVDLPAWNYPLLTAVNCVVPAVLAGNAGHREAQPADAPLRRSLRAGVRGRPARRRASCKG